MQKKFSPEKREFNLLKTSAKKLIYGNGRRFGRRNIAKKNTQLRTFSRIEGFRVWKGEKVLHGLSHLSLSFSKLVEGSTTEIPGNFEFF